jgi:hypothetical protein
MLTGVAGRYLARIGLQRGAMLKGSVTDGHLLMNRE